MDYPMRRYGMTVQEIVLGDLLAFKGPGLVILAAAAAIWPGALLPEADVAGGLLAGATAGAGVLLLLAGAGLRQNRAALDLGQGLLAAVALAWLVWGIVAGRVVPIVLGAALLALVALLTLLRRAAIRARFAPRFFTTRQLETLVAVVDTMIDGDGRQVRSPEEVAVTVDHLMDEIRTPVTAELKTVLVLVEWALPLMIGRPLPFSTLGSHQRRRVVEKVIGAQGLFRDVARSLKVLATAGYYGSEEGMRAMGYVPFAERERGRQADTRPLHHPDPFAGDREALRR